MAELEVLRAARQAIEEGLISTQDYDVVKVAFLRAQQLKAGMDAGFIKQEDYVLARDAYLNALDLSVMAGRGPSTGGPMSTLRASASFDAPLPGAGAGPASNGPAAMPPPATQQPAARSRGPSGAAASSGAATPAGGLSAAGGVPPPAAALPLRSADSYGTSSGGGGPTASLDGGMRGRASASQDALAVPTDVPQYARQGITTGKCSMAGIGLAEDCVNLFMHLKQRSAYKWITFKVDDSGKTVIPDKVGGKGSSYEDFLSTLPDNECRYGVYDYEYVSPDRGSFSKIVFVNWAPESAAIKIKMMYAATKDFFKGFLDGIGAELQASELSEASEEELRQRVVANLTRK